MAMRRQSGAGLTWARPWAQLTVVGAMLALTTIACGEGCSERGPIGAQPGASAAATGSATPTLFDSGYDFACSQDKKVGCSGVLPLRADGDAGADGGKTQSCPAAMAALAPPICA